MYTKSEALNLVRSQAVRIYGPEIENCELWCQWGQFARGFVPSIAFNSGYSIAIAVCQTMPF